MDLVKQTGAQGIPTQAVIMILYICVVMSHCSSHRASTEPTEAVSARNIAKHEQRQAWRWRQRRESSFYPVFPPSSICPQHMVFFLPTPTCRLIPPWKLTHSGNISSADLDVITKIISLEWITSQIHSTPRYWVSLVIICVYRRGAFPPLFIYFWGTQLLSYLCWLIFFSLKK